MALALVSTRGSCGLARTNSSSRATRRTAGGNRTLPVCLASSSSAPAAPDSSKYAILRLGGVRQMLQEGLLYTCPKHCLLQEQSVDAPPAHQPYQQLQQDAASTAGQRSFVLGRVLGLHNGQQFTWGTPYLPNTQVEVEVVEEFPGPKPHTSTAAAEPDTSLMTIYRVMHIRAAE